MGGPWTDETNAEARSGLSPFDREAVERVVQGPSAWHRGAQPHEAAAAQALHTQRTRGDYKTTGGQNVDVERVCMQHDARWGTDGGIGRYGDLQRCKVFSESLGRNLYVLRVDT